MQKICPFTGGACRPDCQLAKATPTLMGGVTYVCSLASISDRLDTITKLLEQSKR